MHFSIITPSFKQLDWLRLCIASVADQGSTVSGRHPEGDSPHTLHVEHIIQDAGTPGIEDFSREVSETLQMKYGGKEIADLQTFELLNFRAESGYTLRIFKEPDSGMYDAINRGLLRASGTLLAYLNCDEQYLPETLETVDAFFSQQKKTDILFGDTVITDTQGGYICSRRVLVPQKLHTLISGNLSIFTSSTFFRRSIVEKKLLFNPAWKAVGDSIWILSLLEKGCKMTAFPHYLSIHTDTGENMINSPKAIDEQHRLFRKAPALARKFKPIIMAHYRLRRFIAGAYHLSSHGYSIYTPKNHSIRKQFQVTRPCFRWPGRG